MKLTTTTGDFAYGYPTDAERIQALHRAGFRHIDLSLYGEARSDSPYLCDGWEKEVDLLRRTADACGMDFVQSHAPGGNPLSFDSQWELLLASTIRTLEICRMLGIPNTVVHVGWADDLRSSRETDRELYFARNMKFINALIPTMEKTGVSVLVENSTHANMGDRCYLYSGQDMKDFTEYAHHPLIGACWDTGHANIEGNQYDDILAMGNCLRAIHFNDNRGTQDEHLMPYLGTLNVDEVMCGLSDIHYDGAFTFECDSSLRPAQYWLGNRREWRGCKPENNRCIEPPVALREAMEHALYQCGAELLTAYGYPIE